MGGDHSPVAGFDAGAGVTMFWDNHSCIPLISTAQQKKKKGENRSTQSILWCYNVIVSLYSIGLVLLDGSELVRETTKYACKVVLV